MKSKNTLLNYYPQAYGIKNPMGENYIVYNGPDTKEAKKKVLGTGITLKMAFVNALYNTLNKLQKS